MFFYPYFYFVSQFHLLNFIADFFFKTALVVNQNNYFTAEEFLLKNLPLF